ncbi:MAG TPA: UDP-N-acetylmuramoyl-tripeptide--D-alanyl-D-alanine ligase [Marinilabiliales bacterium]|nr:MAG: hypothetical protein A2W84_09360 [Bacteroidetes bacterium GWC2_40_13]OFX72990.1 MAG: hypothetical protein A2W96_18930 [Bacteroidetes bacterium GWD2_40_43]OFX92620.1 MAG: hypothetical protein A2W97_08930 [Bacteroidetes bacterium GWE2_40_63]OFY17477.1 MAG: hypothetical protein A2W88_13690 [Bacteroidetes bacterium GWF2_40_13]OFZ27590.1 MAG: hypothetical protein A2437_15115 [Bacteroidetes bacterium RIFOXYC2_FULL_40_12]HAM97244.1 UDP-N-acetylmuramoyl-tripeptide--D-alanyl-D-alanine ligase [M
MNTHELYKIFLKNPKISTDSRALVPGSIFFALKGEKFDANQFALQALEVCAYAVVDDPSSVKGDRFILVDNVLEKLQKLAAFHRKRLGLPIIAITGTNGKTTTKELIAAVMSKRHKVTYTKGNLNNHIGVPLTLLQMTKDDEFGIVEMGANHLGEIAELCKIAAPDFGIITNVGKAHLEGFGSFEGVKKAKGELYRYLYENDGTAFINYDNEILDEMNPPHSVFYYGTKEFTHCQGKLEKNDIFMSFRWISSDDVADENEDRNWEIYSHLVKTKLVGDYNFENALAAVCIGNYFGVPANDISQAIEAYTPQNNRSQLFETPKNTILLDNYNANPSSVKVALENFFRLEFPNKVVMLGEMLELGDASGREHGVVVGQLVELNAKDVYLVGPSFMQYHENDKFRFFSTTIELADFLKQHPLEGKQILLKGSRGMKMEQILDLL